MPVQARGFTLVEILVATVIMGLVVAIVLSSFRSVFGKSDTIGQRLSQSQMILACMSRLSTDIQGAFVQNPALTRSLPEAADKSLDPYRWVADTQLIAGERFSRLRFASRAHVAFGFDDNAGVAEIVYYVQQAGRQRFVLRRSDRLDFDQPFEPSPWDPVLCDDLRGFGITFFDNDRQPVDHWDSQDQSEGHATPRTVHVRIDIGDANGVSRRFETQVSVPVYHEAPK